jgi:hypothetical protein
MSDPIVERSRALLEQAGWVAFETIRPGDHVRPWVVIATQGDTVVEAFGATQTEAWQRACPQALTPDEPTTPVGGGQPLYIVRMDKDGTTSLVAILDEEVEGDEPPMKPGARVRVTVRSRLHGYRPGNTGIVLCQVFAGPRGACCYLVAMDQDDPAASGVVFTDEEIEPDTDARTTP